MYSWSFKISLQNSSSFIRHRSRFLCVRPRFFRNKVLNILCSYRWHVEIAIWKMFCKIFLDIHCTNTVCNNGGFLDQNCECICPDGSSDCQQGKTRQNPGKKKLQISFKNWNISVKSFKMMILNIIPRDYKTLFSHSFIFTFNICNKTFFSRTNQHFYLRRLHKCSQRLEM